MNFDEQFSFCNIRMYKIGDGIEKDELKAKEFAEKAADLIKTIQSKERVTPGFTG